MERTVYEGTIDEEFNGFNEDAVFKLSDGSFWHQVQYYYWYHYEYRPKAIISNNNGRYYLTVAGQSIEVEQLYDVIEGQIDGEFRGWDKNKRYRLTNGQEWEQIEYKYEYSYAYRPTVQIFNINGCYVMYVNGSSARVKRL